MEHTTHPNLVISGYGSSNGGEFHIVKLEGKARVDGGLTCTEFVSHGKSTVHGPVYTKLAVVNGDATINGPLEAERLNVHGRTTINGDLRGERVKVHGQVKVNADCEAEVFTCQGGFEIEGLLNAGEVDITLYGKGRAQEIGGASIKVRRETNQIAKWLRLMFASLNGGLTADTIEGDDIFLEETTAKVVRGNRVTIGAGCSIDLVEYKDELILEGDAIVRQQIQL
ncbi:MAG TPA: bactofilin [Bacilli bacterium]|nr:bactofilin [Bacilli bacterium]